MALEKAGESAACPPGSARDYEFRLVGVHETTWRTVPNQRMTEQEEVVVLVKRAEVRWAWRMPAGA
jgi:hypothetical protein